MLLHWRAVAPRRLGQHFLRTAAWRERIARLVLAEAGTNSAAAVAPDRGVELGNLWIEIGAGHGEMTTLLGSQVPRLIAIELDTKLLPHLRQKTAGQPNVQVVAGDILAIDLGELTGKDHFRAYGNLPYYITSPIVHRLLECADRLDAAFLLIQREVAVRMAAPPGSRDYGYFSAFTQFYSRPEVLLRIPPGAFQPPPKVSSALIALRTPGQRTELKINDEARFLTFLKLCFAQKRKTLRKNLRSLISQTEAVALLGDCQIEPNARAEELGLPELARVFTAMSDLYRTTPSP
jgi:16S rRNA (adenine1518-N6/adenine1519-N6)-dimethyltransferase